MLVGDGVEVAISASELGMGLGLWLVETLALER